MLEEHNYTELDFLEKSLFRLFFQVMHEHLSRKIGLVTRFSSKIDALSFKPQKASSSILYENNYDR